jgi:hypothetical protein
MPALRYVGTSGWNRAHFDDEGNFTHSQVMQPGETFEVSNEAAETLLRGPRFLRNFVQAGGPEDHYGDKFEPSALESVRGNATPYPELDMGSTVQPGRTITRTEDDNPEGHPIADPTQGPQSDNADLVLREEAQQEAEKAYQAKRDAQAKERAKARQQAGSARQSEQRSGEARKSESER